MESPHVPVCNPSMLKDGTELRSVQEMLQYPVVKMAPPWNVWRLWLEENGVTDLSNISGPVMENIYLAVKAAEEGQGIAFAPLAFIQEKLTAGQLAIAFNSPSQICLYFTLSCSSGWQNNPRILAFREWLNDELGTYSGMDMGYSKAAISQ